MGSKQFGLGDYEQSTAKKRTKLERFLSEVELVVPWQAPPLPGKLTPLHSDHFSPGGLMEQSNASLQRGSQG